MYLEYHTVVVLCLFFLFWREIVLVLCTCLVYNTVVRLGQFFCCGGKANLVWLTLFYSTLLTLMGGQKDGQRNKYTRYAWAGGTFFPVVLLCQYLVLVGNRFWFYILHIHMYSEYIHYSCGVVLVFFNLAGNSFWCYVRT
jgi:hypothetical protein